MQSSIFGEEFEEWGGWKDIERTTLQWKIATDSIIKEKKSKTTTPGK